ncbi:MAG: ABC transporter permease [Nitrospirae bacterium]|nr:ABC transporter permease [Nitrospirota bacterium]
MLRHIADLSRNFITHRHLLAHMVVRDVRGRFAGSSAGLLWNFIHPLVMLLVYLFVFVYIFKLRLPDYAGSKGAVIYLMAGLFPWMAMAEGLIRSTSSLIENANLIQRSVFPPEILPAKAVIAAFSSHGIAIAMLAAYSVITEQSYGIIIYLPLIVILQVMFTLGIGFIFACISVFFRDILQVLQLVIGFWIYATPILYPLSMLPEWAQKAMYINPVYPFASLYQSLFLNGGITDYTMVTLLLAWTILFYAAGAFIFSKLKYEFADWL